MGFDDARGRRRSRCSRRRLLLYAFVAIAFVFSLHILVPWALARAPPPPPPPPPPTPPSPPPPPPPPKRSHLVRADDSGASRCLVDDLLGGDSDGGDDASWRVDDDSERYLVYAPQFGLGNQQITLRNAVVWAIFLNRTLVLPHILGHSGCSNESLCSATSQEMAAHADLFAIRQIPPVRVLDMRHFRRRSGGALRPRRLLVLGIKAVWAYRMTDVYWEQLGVAWHREPLDVPLTSFDGAGITAAFGACRHHRVLAFRSLFAALVLDAKQGGGGYPPPGRNWLNAVAMPSLYKPHGTLGSLADTIAASLRHPEGDDEGKLPRRLACVHIRLGDILEDCEKYAAEATAADGRPWVRANVQGNYSCQQPLVEVVANLKALQARAADAAAAEASSSHRAAGRSPPVAIYAAIEDPSALQKPQLEPFRMASLASFGSELEQLVAASSLPKGLVSVLLDQMVCARSQHLLLNIWSTFSQMMLTRIGLDHPKTGGWARGLTDRTKRRLGLDVSYWRTPAGLAFDEAQKRAKPRPGPGPRRAAA